MLPVQWGKQTHADPLEVLRKSYEAGKRTYGPLQLEFDAYAKAVTARVHRRLQAAGVDTSEEHVSEALACSVGADLFLAIACERGAPAAWEALNALFVPRLRGLARRRGVAGQDDDDIARDVLARLASPAPGDGYPLIASYDGTGTLFAWLSVMLLRQIADRKRSRELLPLDGIPADARSDPACRAADAEATGCFLGALRVAWETLTAKEVLALSLKFRDGLRQREIAGLLGVGAPRMSRIVNHAIHKLRREVYRRCETTSVDDDLLWKALRDAVGQHLAAYPAGDSPLREDGTSE